MREKFVDETCEKFLSLLEEHFVEANHGYLNMKELIEDTVLTFSSSQEIEPFSVNIDEMTESKITTRAG